MRKALLLLVVLAGFLAGCENKYKDPDPQAMGYEYFPLEIGDYRIYDVTDIRFTSNVGDTTRFQMRERVDTSFTDQTNQVVYKVVRSIRLNPNSAWIDDSVMVVAKTSKMVLLTKNNTKFVKLIFPVKSGFKWELDAYNDRLIADPIERIYKIKEQYIYKNVGEPFAIDGKEFTKTITVTPLFGSNTSQINDRREIYAEGIGLVYRLFNRVVYCEATSVQDCPKNVEYKQSGHERHEVLVSHGKM